MPGDVIRCLVSKFYKKFQWKVSQIAENKFLKHDMYEHEEKKEQCTKCGKRFTFDSQLQTHLKTHHKLKPFIYSWAKNGVRCKKYFNYTGDLNRHEKSCTSKDKRNLKQYMRVHSNCTPYKCSKCGKSFRYWMQWSRHRC